MQEWDKHLRIVYVWNLKYTCIIQRWFNESIKLFGTIYSQSLLPKLKTSVITANLEHIIIIVLINIKGEHQFYNYSHLLCGLGMCLLCCLKSYFYNSTISVPTIALEIPQCKTFHHYFAWNTFPCLFHSFYNNAKSFWSITHFVRFLFPSTMVSWLNMYLKWLIHWNM